jgi:hypothetical protein
MNELFFVLFCMSKNALLAFARDCVGGLHAFVSFIDSIYILPAE